LVNADTDVVIGILTDGATIDVDAIGTRNLNIIAQATNAESVVFSGSYARNENQAPYTLAGDNNGDYGAILFADGSYTVTARAYSQDNALGSASAPFTINFTVTSTPTTNAVTGLLLVNADTDTVIGALNIGDVIDVDVIGTRNLNIIAVVDGVESVIFSGSFARNENQAPYTIAGDSNGDYWALTLTNGSYTVTATAYSEDNALGIASTPLTISFTVVGS
jgi:hypothetical protein